MQRQLTAAIAALLCGAIPVANALPISKAHIPVKSSEWHQLSDAAKSGYALGAMQTAAYIEGKTDAQSGCISRLDEPLIGLLDTGSSDSDFVVFDAMELAMGTCETAPPQDDGMVSVERVSAVLGNEQSEIWYGMVIGIADYLKVLVHGNIGESAADCVEDITLGVAGLDFSDPSKWTDTPDEPFVELVVNAAMNECGLFD